MATAFNEPKYQIDASNFQCHSCGAEVPCEAAYYSAIFFVEEVFQRKDYCLVCWQHAIPPGADVARPAGSEPTAVPGEVFAYWRARRPPLPSERPRRVHFDPDLVLQFFRRLEAKPDGEAPPAAQEPPPATVEADPVETRVAGGPEMEEVRFVLSLLLIRKKCLNFLGSRLSDGGEWLKLSEKREPDRVHWVRNPDLADSRLEKVKDRIGELLQMRV